MSNVATRRCYDILNMTREHIREAMVINFKGQKFVKIPQLEQHLPVNLIAKLFCCDEETSQNGETSDTPDVKDKDHEIKTSALRLLALCIWADVPLHAFSTLFADGIRDDDLPLDENFANPSIDTAIVQLILKYQSYFIPFTVIDDGGLLNVATQLPLPILFDELDDRIGHGSFSEVFRAEVDIEAKASCQNTIVALKRFKSSRDTEAIFHRERILLEELRNRRHNHIVIHLTSIIDDGTFYILFPLAQCDLRTFLNQTRAPTLQGNVVLWFFSQVRGLADALFHLHALGDSVVTDQWTPDHEFSPSRPAQHGDVKPENILIFPSTSERCWGTLKISDFGSAQTSNDSQRFLPREENHLWATEAYASPDLSSSSELTCATDVWSLGCVFLELLVWLFYSSGSEQTGFMTRRSYDALPHSASFWMPSGDRRLKLKPSVIKQLLDLRSFDCYGRVSFEHFIQLIWYLLDDDPTQRFSALRAANDTASCFRQAELDLSKNPSFFLDPPVECSEYARPVPSWTVARWWFRDGPKYAKAAIVHLNKGIHVRDWSAKYTSGWRPNDLRPRRLSPWDRKLMSVQGPYVNYADNIPANPVFAHEMRKLTTLQTSRPLYPWVKDLEEEDM